VVRMNNLLDMSTATQRQAADYVGVSHDHFRRYIRAGDSQAPLDVVLRLGVFMFRHEGWSPHDVAVALCKDERAVDEFQAAVEAYRLQQGREE